MVKQCKTSAVLSIISTISITITMFSPSCLKKNLSAGGSLPWRRHLLLPVHHHTELFVAELVVLQMYFLFVFFLLHVDVNLVFYSIKIPFTPDDNQFISIQSCAPPTNHLVVVVFSESRVNLRFAQTPTSSLRKANWLKLTLLPRWNDEYNRSVLYIEAYLRGDH